MSGWATLPIVSISPTLTAMIFRGIGGFTEGGVARFAFGRLRHQSRHIHELGRRRSAIFPYGDGTCSCHVRNGVSSDAISEEEDRKWKREDKPGPVRESGSWFWP